MGEDIAERARRIRSSLDHPVVDSDGHDLEYLPWVRDEIHGLAGAGPAERFDAFFQGTRLARTLTPEQRRSLGVMRVPWWALPAEVTLDRATAMLPRLLHERLPALGIDFAVVYPTYGLLALSIDEDEVRAAACRAFNRCRAEAFAGLGDRLAPVALVPMHTPAEALAELDHVVGELGYRAVLLAGHVLRPLAPGAPRGARWLDTFGPDSPHDYDPVFARCVELGVSPTFHSSGMGWGSRLSTTSYVHNHLGNFAAAGEATCRSLFLAGVPWRFPELRFAFLEGGVGWACSLYADLIGHWEKRNREAVRRYDPSRLDRTRLRELLERHGPKPLVERLDHLDESLAPLSEPDEDPSAIDEFAACPIDGPEAIRDVFTRRFFFGCEADDPMTPAAYDSRRNPLGARLHALFSSDIGHWDVPDMREVLVEAYEAVEDGLLTPEDFRRFVFGSAVAFWAGANLRFFEGTAVEAAAARERDAS